MTTSKSPDKTVKNAKAKEVNGNFKHDNYLPDWVEGLYLIVTAKGRVNFGVINSSFPREKRFKVYPFGVNFPYFFSLKGRLEKFPQGGFQTLKKGKGGLIPFGREGEVKNHRGKTEGKALLRGFAEGF